MKTIPPSVQEMFDRRDAPSLQRWLASKKPPVETKTRVFLATLEQGWEEGFKLILKETARTPKTKRQTKQLVLEWVKEKASSTSALSDGQRFSLERLANWAPKSWAPRLADGALEVLIAQDQHDSFSIALAQHPPKSNWRLPRAERVALARPDSGNPSSFFEALWERPAALSVSTLLELYTRPCHQAWFDRWLAQDTWKGVPEQLTTAAIVSALYDVKDATKTSQWIAHLLKLGMPEYGRVPLHPSTNRGWCMNEELSYENLGEECKPSLSTRKTVVLDRLVFISEGNDQTLWASWKRVWTEEKLALILQMDLDAALPQAKPSPKPRL